MAPEPRTDPERLAQNLRDLVVSLMSGDGLGDLPLGWTATIDMLSAAADTLDTGRAASGGATGEPPADDDQCDACGGDGGMWPSPRCGTCNGTGRVAPLPDTAAPEGHVLIDHMESGENRLECSCGVQIHPDCDVSSTSIAAEFAEHLRTVAAGGAGVAHQPPTDATLNLDPATWPEGAYVLDLDTSICVRFGKLDKRYNGMWDVRAICGGPSVASFTDDELRTKWRLMDENAVALMAAGGVSSPVAAPEDTER